MIVLGIETSSDVGSVAVCDDGAVLAAHVFPPGPRHARNIMPAVDDVLGRAGLGKYQVDAVAVSEGPGSFTGLRIGIACAKALAFALGWRCVGVPSLEVLVQNVSAAEARAHAIACPVRDARRDRVYGTIFRWEEGRWRDTTGVLLEPPAALAARLPRDAIVFGSGVGAYPELFPATRFAVGPAALETGRAEATARLGRERIRAGAAADPLVLVPRYYRLTEAEEQLNAAGPPHE